MSYFAARRQQAGNICLVLFVAFLLSILVGSMGWAGKANAAPMTELVNEVQVQQGKAYIYVLLQPVTPPYYNSVLFDLSNVVSQAYTVQVAYQQVYNQVYGHVYGYLLNIAYDIPPTYDVVYTPRIVNIVYEDNVLQEVYLDLWLKPPPSPPGEGAPPGPPTEGKGQVTAGPGQGGSASTPDKYNSVDVPADAVQEEVLVTIKAGSYPSGVDLTGFVATGAAVNLTVASQSTGQMVTSFAQPLVLKFVRKDAAGYQVYYWNEELGVWVEVASSYDSATGTFTVYVDHLTLFAVMKDTSGIPAPTITPLPGTVAAEAITVSGTAKAGSTVAVVVNNATKATVTADAAGTYNAKVPLDEGRNVILVIASSAGIKRASREQVVVYKPIALTDLAGHWAEAYVKALVAAGVITGYEDSTFRPERDVTRAEFVAMLARLLGIKPLEGAKVHFADAAEIGWATGYVAAMVQQKLVAGYEIDGKFYFKPRNKITRAEMAALIVRAIGYKRVLTAPATSGPSFGDAAGFPAWAAPSIDTAVRYGIVTGYPDGTFKQGNFATRAEAATMMKRLLDLK